MALTISPGAGPIAPDFHICDPVYGEGLSTSSCLRLANALPVGTAPVPYSVNRPGRNPIYSLPFVIRIDECWLAIEAAGPAGETVQDIMIAPDTLREMAAWVIQQCVTDSNGIGGFRTNSFAHMVNHVDQLTINPAAPYPISTTFITLTISGFDGKRFSPGDTDPLIPVAFAEFMSLRESSNALGPASLRVVNTLTHYWLVVALASARGSTIKWWEQQPSQSRDEMSYSCDTRLGSPSITDCTQLEWNQLGPSSTNPPSDTVTVGPGVVRFLHSNTCYLAISAVVSTVLNWNQIRAAVGALMNICIQHPLRPSSGGRAFYSTSAKVSRKRQNQVSGLNALPYGVNITMFEQRKPWESQAAELTSCTWHAIFNQLSTSVCNG